MPTYEYECKSCSHNFEVFQAMSDPPVKECIKCGNTDVRRLIFGGAGVIFKGSGFYVTDKNAGKNTGKKSDKTENKDSSSKPDSCASCVNNNAEKCPAIKQDSGSRTGNSAKSAPQQTARESKSA
jgi:putative FmdB family regulatory protein